MLFCIFYASLHVEKYNKSSQTMLQTSHTILQLPWDSTFTATLENNCDSQWFLSVILKHIQRLNLALHQWKPTKFWDLNHLLEMLVNLFQFMMYVEPGTRRILIYLPSGHWNALGTKLNSMWNIILTLCKTSRFETSRH